MDENKVIYGLKNVHYAVITENADGTISYSTPKRIPGAVSLTKNPVGEVVEFFADDGDYYSENNNNGYDGDLTIAKVPDDFRIDVLGEEYVDGVLYENSNNKPKKFALLFEFNGDKKAKRHVLYYCSATRPTISSTTKTATKEIQTTTLTLQSRPRPTDGMVKADTAGLSQAQYDAWYTAVHEKTSVAATSVTLLPDTVNLAVGGIQQLAATVLPANATNRNVSYSSDDTAIATVSETGLVTAKAVGTATITVTTVDGGFTDTCAVTVA